MIEDTESKKQELFDPFEHKLVKRLLPEYMQEITDCKLEMARLEDEKTAFEKQGDADDLGDDEEDNGERLNCAKELETELKGLKSSIKESLDRIKYLSRGPNVKDKGSIAARKKLGDDTTKLETELTQLQAEVEPVHAEMEIIEEKLAPWKEIKKQLSEQRKKLKILSKALLDKLEEARQDLSADDCCELAIDLAREDLERLIRRYVDEHLRGILAVLDVLWEKYGVDFRTISSRREEVTKHCDELFAELNYVS